jgi:hypothetical protein
VVVDRDSAMLGSTKELILDLNADHSNLCKFESSDDAGYRIVAGHLENLMREALTCAERYHEHEVLSQ